MIVHWVNGNSGGRSLSHIVNEPAAEKRFFYFRPHVRRVRNGIEEILVKKHGAQKGHQLYSQVSSLTTNFCEYHDMKQLKPIF